jgi:hypothetical protein
MSNWYWILLALTFGVPFSINVLRRWIYAPFVIYRTKSASVNPGFEIAAPEHFTAEMRDTLQHLLPDFRNEGFEAMLTINHANGVPGVRGIQTLLVNRATQDVAVIIGSWSRATRSVVFAIRSEFPDGSKVVTGVNRGIGIFPPDPAGDYQNFPWVNDAATLCEAHRRRLRRAGKFDRLRTAPAPGEEMAYSLAEWQRENQRHVRVGYRRLDADAGLYRFTLRGACLSTWRLTPPIKNWRIKRRDRKALRAWRELDMHDYRPPFRASPGAAAPAAATSSPYESPVAPAPSNLTYETTLREGEIREDQSPGQLTVRMGTPTVPRYLVRRWPTLLMIGLWCALLSLNIYFSWRIQITAIRLGLPPRFPAFRVSTIVFLLFLLADVAKLLFAVISLRGTIVLTASPQGLTFRNAPGLTPAGHIPRADLEGLSVHLHENRFRKKLYRLVAKTESNRRQTLLISADHPRLEHLRATLARTIGIE